MKNWIQAFSNVIRRGQGLSKEQPDSTSAGDYSVLEDRIFFSASPLPIDSEPVDSEIVDVEPIGQSAGEDFAAGDPFEAAGLSVEAAFTDLANVSSGQELVVIDSSVVDSEQLIAQLEQDTSRELVLLVLPSGENGIEQISEHLEQLRDLEAIHIVSHGNEDGLNLGDLWLTNDNLQQFSGSLEGWQDALADGADLLLYGCNLADGEDGQRLISSLNELTGADVAASDDVTGHETLGGDWDFEYLVGTVETDLAFSVHVQQNWYSTLNITSNLVGHYEFDTGGATLDSTGNQDASVSSGNATGETPAAVGDQAVGFAVDASGNNSYLEVANNFAQDFGTEDFTVSLWYNQNGTPGTVGRMIGDFGGSGNGFVIYAQSNGAIDVQLHDGTTITESIQGIFDGTWNQLTVVRTGATLDIYHNGVSVSSSTGADGNINSSNALWMGSSGTLGGDYDGQLDDVRLYTRALSSTDVDELVALGPAVATPPGPPEGYSNPTGGDNSLDYITNVTFAGINNSSGQDIAGYGNYTTEIGSVTLGDNNNLSVTIVEDNDNYVTAWVDWNQDGDFSDPGEEYVVVSATSSPGPHTINIATPGTATLGTTVMRVGTTWGQVPAADGRAEFREFEDYTVNVTGGTPQTYTVTNTLDDGSVGSLRWAIQQANANAGHDTIDFNIAGSGTQVIALGSDLDTITDQVTIDGTTQTGWVEQSFMPIVIDANDLGTGIALGGTADGSEIRGLLIRDAVYGLHVTVGSENHLIAGNWFGQFNSDGSDAGIGEAITSLGVYGDDANNVTFGGTTAADRNVIVTEGASSDGLYLYKSDGWNISGNYFGTDTTGNALLASTTNAGNGFISTNDANTNTIGGATDAHRNIFAGLRNGVEFQDSASAANYVYNNWIGLGADGATVIGNQFNGVSIFDTHDVVVGGAGGLGNVIVGSGASGIYTGDNDDVVIQGNYIGQNEDGSVVAGNDYGIYVGSPANNITIGGIAAGEGNVITASANDGIEIVSSATALTTSIRGNSIFDNDGLGIDLGADGRTANDAGDADTGANNLQNWTVLNSASIDDLGNFSYSLDLSTLAAGTYTVDFYASSDRDGGQVEGQRYLFSQNVSGSGTWTGGFGGVTLAPGEYVTLITTDADGNSSEFSNYAAATDSDAGGAIPSDLTAVATSEGGLRVNDDGGDDTYLIADNGDTILGGRSSFTYEIEFASTQTNWSSLGSYATSGNVDEFRLQIGGSSVAHLDIAGGQVSLTAIDYRTLFDGSKQQLSITWDNASGDWAVYSKGVLLESGTGLRAGATIASGGTLVFGQDQDGVGSNFDLDWDFSGTLYRARFFDDARTPYEISASYQTDLSHDEPGMIAQWNFDHLSTDGIITDTVSGNNLTVQHVAETGFTASTPELTFSLNENSPAGTVIGSVSGVDAEREALIATLLAADPGLRYNAETGKFYKVVGGAQLWSEARTAAESTALNTVNGQLATIRSAYENEFLRDLINTTIGYDAWIGGTDSTVEGEWRWVDGGSEADLFWRGDENGNGAVGAYHNFASGQPNDSGGNEDVIHMDETTGLWSDADHDTHNFYGYVIEWNADEVLDATQALTYSIQSQTVDGAFEIDVDSGQIRVLDSSLLDADTLAAHTVTVRVSDNAAPTANTYDEAFTISLNNLVEANGAPTDLSSGIELNSDGGNDAYLVANDGGALLGGLGTFTFESTFVVDSPTDNTMLVQYGDSTADAGFFALVDNGGTLWIGINENPTSFTGTNYSNLLFDGQLHHFAASWDNSSGSIAVYVDGELLETQTGFATGVTLPGTSGNGTLQFGQDFDSVNGTYNSTGVFNGTLYDARFWSEVRSEAEISLNYQHKFDSGSLPTGLIANWQMDGFNGSNEVVDVVSGNNLTVGHASGTGFVASVPVGDLHIVENATNGTTVGYVQATDRDFHNDIVDDGSFLAAPGSDGVYSAGATVGGWTVGFGDINLNVTAMEASPLGGPSVELNGTIAGSIEQVLATQEGRTYQVTFALSGNWNLGDAVKDLRVSAGGESADFSITEPDNWSQSNLGWEHRSFNFTADSADTLLQFIALDSGNTGAIVSDIQVIEVPQAISTILNNDPTLSYDAATGKFYRHVNTTETWQDAQTAAIGSQLNGVSGQLVTVRSAYENELVRNLAIGGGSGAVWLGGSDRGTEGTFQWHEGANAGETFWNGAAVSGQYQNFSSGEPNDWAGEGGQDFVGMTTSTGLWDDRGGTDAGPLAASTYMIEWDASQVLSNFTFTLTDDAGGRFAIDSNTGEITVADGSQLNYETATSHNVTVEVTDAAGNTYSEAMAIAIDDGFELGQTVPGAQVTAEDTALAFTGPNAITVTDGLASADTRLQVHITTNFNGTLTLSQTTGLTIGGGSNGGTFMSIHGTESDINAAFDGMTFTPANGYTGPVTIDVTTSLGADLEGRYEFDGDANDTGLGLTQHGTLTGGATITNDGTRGDVLLLDNPYEHVVISSRFNEPADVTLAAWINLDSAMENAEVISLGNNLVLRADDSAKGLYLGYYQGSGVWNDLGAVDVNLDGQGWNHVAATFDDTNDRIAIYLNGEEVASLHTTDSIDWTDDANTSASTYIGTHGNGSASFDFQGMIDDARIYDRALSAGEIAALAANQDTVTDSIAVTVAVGNQAPYFTSLPSAEPETVESLSGAVSVTSADFDNDGDTDLVSTTNTGELRWHENVGNGTFSTGVVIATADDFSAVAVYDLEGDGDMDIVAMNDDPTDLGDSVYVLTNNFIGSGAVSFSTTSFEGPGVTDSDGGQDLAIGDIDGDGRADIAGLFYRSIGDSQVVVFEQNAVGVWTKTYSDAISNGSGIELVDLDGDTDLDIVTGDFQTREINWYENDGNATAGFNKQLIHDEVTSQIFDITVGDFDADGDSDIAYLTWGTIDVVAMLENDGAANPGFTRVEIDTLTGLPYHIHAADTNNDGTLDLIVADEASDAIVVYENDGNADFTQNTIDANSRGPVWVEAADVDGDGQNDLIFAARDENFVGLHVNQGDGNYIRGTVNEDIALGTLGVQIADDDAGAAILEVTINVTNGDVILNTASVTVLSGASSSPTITFEGTVADLNTALANLTYSPTTDFNGIGEVEITVDDRGNTGAGGALTATESLFVEVLPQPDPVTDAHYTTWIGDSEFIVNTETTGSQDSPGVTALADGGFVVVWESDGQDTDNEGVYFQRYDAAGNAIGSETPVNTTVANSQDDPEVTALSNGGFVIVWESAGQDTDNEGVYLRVFDADGAAVSGEVPVNTETTDHQDTPEIAALNGGGFVVVWESLGQDSDSDGIYFQRFNDAGGAQGIETRANVTTTGEQGDPRVTGTNDGGFVVAWEDNSSGDYEVVARRFDAAGASISGEIPINTTTTGTQDDAVVQALSGGGFVAIWESVDQDGDENGIFGQRFDAAGAAVGGEFQVHSSTTGNQQDQRVQSLADGGFIVLWESGGDQDGDDSGVYAQQFDSAGNKVNGEFQINTTTAANQANPDVTILNDGRMVAVWDADGQDGNDDAVVGRIFTPALNENSPVGTVAAVVSQVVDPDVGDVYSYTLTDNAGRRLRHSGRRHNHGFGPEFARL